jgi:hypothetical protein
MTHSPARFFASLLLASLLLSSFTPPPQSGPGHGRPKTQARPALSGQTLTHPTAHFLIHYTLNGEDAIAAADDNGDDLPDYVEDVAEALEFSWQRQIKELGWRSPLPDEGEGGDTKLDVYLEDQTDSFGSDNLFGYTDTFGGLVGDNPATARPELGAAYGYLSLDNGYDPDQFGYYELTSLEAMRVTAAHEFNHALQAAYDDNDPYSWLYEATAVWMEEEVYPEIGDARSYLADYMDAPDLCPLSVGRDDQDVRWYGGWILLRYLAEQSGGPETIRQLWENMAGLDGLAALKATLAQQKTTLPELLVNFSIAILTQSNCPSNAPYCYRHGSDYLRPYVEGSLQLDAGESKAFIPKDGVQQFGADYIRLKSDKPIRLDFQGSAAGQWQLWLVGLTGAQVRVISWPETSPTEIDPTKFEKLYLLVVNTAPVEEETDCGYHNYSLAAAPAESDTLPQAPAVLRDPAPYIAPVYAGGSETEKITNAPTLSEGQPISLEEAPFPPLYPGHLPPGYTLAEVISYTSADLGEWKQAYAPGGEPILGLIYRDDRPDSFLAMTQSPAPAQTLAEWREARAYAENEVRLINDLPVHLVEYNDESGQLSIATFIYHDLFIVLEGSFDLIELQQIVAGFLANNP